MDMDPVVFFNTSMPGAYVATYFPNAGAQIETVVLIDYDAEQFPAAFESQHTGRQIVVTLRHDHVPNPQRGDRIEANGEVYKVDGPPIYNDRFGVRVPVK